MQVLASDDAPVLVGVDGSEESRRAVRWAAREARSLGCGLRIVHAWLWPLYRVPLGPAPGAPAGAGLRHQAERVLTTAAEVAHSVAGPVPVETQLVVGAAAAQLLDQAQGARLVVVGNRGLGGFTGLLVGSVGIALSAHAPCPVVVVRGNETAAGPVVVGVGGDGPEDDDVLAAGFEQAARRGTGLVAVHAWSLDLHGHPGDGDGRRYTDEVDALRSGAALGRELLEKSVARVGASYPGVAVEQRLGDRSPAAELVAASADGQLLVVGSHGMGGLRGLVMGSTTHAALHHATCPVLVHR